jgi:hypothetical protein
MYFTLLLTLKNLLILCLLLWLCFKLYGCEATRWRDAGIFVSAGVLFLFFAALVLLASGDGDAWTVYLLVEKSWTFTGDVAMLFIGGGYSFLAIALCRTFRIVSKNTR